MNMHNFICSLLLYICNYQVWPRVVRYVLGGFAPAIIVVVSACSIP